jgi:hypothetical protein
LVDEMLFLITTIVHSRSRTLCKFYRCYNKNKKRASIRKEELRFLLFFTDK